MKNLTLILALAHIAHEANRAYCTSIGDTSQLPWDDAPEWQKDSAMKGIEGALAGNTPEQQHQSWLDVKVADGWVYGDVKDADAKTHPCIVPYAELPAEQQRKDHLYGAVVRAAFGALTGQAEASEPAPAVGTRAKFKVVGKTEGEGGTGSVSLQAVYSGSEENKAFFRFTPAGSISLNILNPGAMATFEQGAEYYVDFTRAE